MSLPRHPAKFSANEKVKATILHERLKSAGRAPKYKIPENIVLCFNGREGPKWSVSFERKSFFGAKLDLMTKTPWAVLSGMGMGAPAMAFYLELLSAHGAKRVVALGQAGALSEKYKIGDVLLVDKALRDEGTSFHYLPPGEFTFPNEKLSRRLYETLSKEKSATVKRATVWTTDAIFRETEAEVNAFAAQGVAAVDMETSALFAVAHHRKIEAASVLVISDELWQTAWNPQFATVTGLMQTLGERIIASRWEL